MVAAQLGPSCQGRPFPYQLPPVPVGRWCPRARDICQDLEHLLQCKQNFPVGCGVLAPTNTSGISWQAVLCRSLVCSLVVRSHVFYIYIYIHNLPFFFKVKVAVPLSSLRTLLPSCSSVVNAGAFWQRFGLQQTENLRSTQDAALGLFPLHTHPQLCCEVSLRGDVLPVAGFCI